MQPGSKYFETAWRKVPEYQGGFLLDGGVHFVAGLRLLLGAAGTKVARLNAFTRQNQEHLPPVDTVDAILQADDGTTGTFSVAFGTTAAGGAEYHVACERGTVTVGRGSVLVRRKQEDGDFTHETKEFPQEGSGVKQEVKAWGQSLAAGDNPDGGSQGPQEALRDLEVLETMLKSGENGGEGLKLMMQR